MDPFVTIESIIQSAEHVEVSRVKIIPEAQHFPHQEKSDAVNKAIIKFLIGEFYFVHFSRIKFPLTKVIYKLFNLDDSIYCIFRVCKIF